VKCGTHIRREYFGGEDKSGDVGSKVGEEESAAVEEEKEAGVAGDLGVPCPDDEVQDGHHEVSL